MNENKQVLSVRGLVTALRAENNKHIECIKSFEKREQEGRYASGVASIPLEEQLAQQLDETKYHFKLNFCVFTILLTSYLVLHPF